MSEEGSSIEWTIAESVAAIDAAMDEAMRGSASQRVYAPSSNTVEIDGDVLILNGMQLSPLSYRTEGSKIVIELEADIKIKKTRSDEMADDFMKELKNL